MNNLPRAQWSSFSSYVLVTTGAVVGLGNIFLFPFLVGKYGGLFVLFYVLCELLIGIPMLLSEFLIGRHGKQNAVGAISLLAMETKASPYWRWLGWLCAVIAFITLSYYTVAVAFPVDYLGEIINAVVTQQSWVHTDLSANFPQMESCFILFLLVTMVVVGYGINRGLERISRITVPLYFILLFLLAIYAVIEGNFSGAVDYLFHTGTSYSLLTILFAALTYAFFKLGIGMGTMIIYGSYLPYGVSYGKSTAAIVGLDALVSLLAYFIIYPLLLLSGNTVPSLDSIPYENVIRIFLDIPNGIYIAALFFLTVVIAAWTPTIAMAEAITATLTERFECSRVKVAIGVGVGGLLLGTVVVLSYSYWSQIQLFNLWTLRVFIQGFAANILTPISVFLIAIFIGWVVNKRITANELKFSPSVYNLWLLLVRFIVPVAIVGICLINIFSR